MISPTAALVAHMRAETDIPYCKEIAERIGAGEIARDLLGDNLNLFLRFRGAYTELRYKALDAALARFGPDCVLELASGLAPRGLASHLPYLETDLPDMLEVKAELVAALGRRPGHRLQSVDVMDAEALLQAAASLPGERLAIIHEGLLLYFDLAEKERAARNLARVMDQRPGSAWLTTDIYLRNRYESVMQTHSHVAGAVESLRQATGRDLVENAFADEGEAHEFFKGLGFAVQKFSQRELVPKLSFGLDQALLDSLLREEVWIMTRR